MISIATALAIALATGIVTMVVGYMIGQARGKMYLKMAYDLADRTQKQAEILKEAFMDLFEVDLFEDIKEEEDEQ